MCIIPYLFIMKVCKTRPKIVWNMQLDPKIVLYLHWLNNVRKTWCEVEEFIENCFMLWKGWEEAWFSFEMENVFIQINSSAEASSRNETLDLHNTATVWNKCSSEAPLISSEHQVEYSISMLPGLFPHHQPSLLSTHADVWSISWLKPMLLGTSDTH